MEIFFAIIFGLIIGSFLTVCVFRIPHGRPKGPPSLDEEDVQDDKKCAGNGGCVDGKDLGSGAKEVNEAARFSIVSPARSICPECGAKLKWWHNVPLLSWIFLRGRCGFCQKPIPARYPLIELLSAVFCVLSLLSYGLTPTALVIYLFCCALIVISFIDIDYYIIPDVISLPGAAIGLVVGLLSGFTQLFSAPIVASFWWSLAGFAFGGGVLLFISELYYRMRHRIGLGMGDVKLLAMTGSFFGIEAAFYTMFVGSVAGAFLGVLMMAFKGRKITYQLPFGPYLALGTVLYLFTPDSVAMFLGDMSLRMSGFIIKAVGVLEAAVHL